MKVGKGQGLEMRRSQREGRGGWAQAGLPAGFKGPVTRGEMRILYLSSDSWWWGVGGGNDLFFLTFEAIKGFPPPLPLLSFP